MHGNAACEIFHKFPLRVSVRIRMLQLIVRLMAFTAVYSLLLLAFGACGPRITNQNVAVVNQQRTALEKIGKGISPKEVESILGQPAHVETFKIPLETQKSNLDGVRYFYRQGDQTLELHFVDNKLISDVPALSKPNMGGTISR